MNVAHNTIFLLAFATGIWNLKPDLNWGLNSHTESQPNSPKFDPLRPIRQWLDQIVITDPKTARLICKLIPAQCPFERKITVFGHTLLRIPPLCKLNPLYEEVVSLRFRALCYLADVCGEDVSTYC